MSVGGTIGGRRGGEARKQQMGGGTDDPEKVIAGCMGAIDADSPMPVYLVRKSGSLHEVSCQPAIYLAMTEVFCA